MLANGFFFVGPVAGLGRWVGLLDKVRLGSGLLDKGGSLARLLIGLGQGLVNCKGG